MSSEFEQEMTSANQDILNTFGSEVTYTPKTGQAKQVTAIAGPVQGDLNEDEGDETVMKFRSITVPVSEITAAGIGDIVTVDGTDWMVVKPPDIASGMAELQCRWDKAVSKHHETHKRKLPTG